MCKIVKSQKFMCQDFMKLIKSQKVSVLYYSIDFSLKTKSYFKRT